MTDDERWVALDRPVVLVDRARPGFLPDYSVFGYTACVMCRQKVWLGHETGRAVMAEDGPHPLCLDCVEEVRRHKPDEFNPEQKVGRIEDGACPKCGGFHPPTHDHN